MKLVTLNLEGDRHLDVAIPFLEREQADVICLQEIYQPDIENIAERLSMSHRFEPMALRPRLEQAGNPLPFGIGMLSVKEMRSVTSHVYSSAQPTLALFNDSTPETTNATVRRSVLIAHIDELRIGTTHFTWSPHGVEDDAQLQSFPKLIAALNPYPELVLCGDLNIPRGVNRLYVELAKYFTDCIPLDIAGSIDVARHRVHTDPEKAKRISRYMVDYILTRGAYSVSNVRQVCGVSDHCAFVAKVTTAPA